MARQGGLNFRRGQLSRLVPVVEHCLALGGNGYVRWELEDDALTRMHFELAVLRQVGG
ncbi:MAG: hypothetical protein AAFN08_08170 [Cyanobacteria bacterium J06559_3]